MNKCNYCELGERNQPIINNQGDPIAGEIMIFVVDNSLILEHTDQIGLYGEKEDISYCPKCGRRLNEN